MKKICVIGLGYIGLPTTAILALHEYKVIGVDINEKILEKLNKGEIHFTEPFLGNIVKTMVDKEKIMGKTQPEKADVFIIAVPTPCKEDKSCDLTYLISAVKSILPYIEKDNIIIIESTIPPGTTDGIIKSIIEEKTKFKVGHNIYLAHCPERVLPGNIIKEIVENNRIVGGCTRECSQKAANVYRAFVKGEIFVTDAKTAEMSKLMENTFRDVNIALANELVTISNHLQINGLDVISIANKHPRVNIHNPGPGVGGHCLAIDPYFIIEKAPQLSNIISTARKVNSSMPHYILSNVKELMKDIHNPKIAVFGITYKGNVTDIRESPAIEIIKLLENENFKISIYDPHVQGENLNIVSIDEAVEGADMILILAAHDEFKNLNYINLIKTMKNPIIFDTTNIINLKNYDNTHINIKNLGNLFHNSYT
ncbi:MAG: nucleotide sugar dehydrogenase [Anaeromicrobium sp.]|uniref:nucleotide sugar dehydrogenase n=1 Tax=Anaeromicrobium sp. TaxID=1929132 RepID=UPI0025D1BE00|nr:nucleotide sugar dehydrogenase [Anaeromicrobium sp.]MCT4595512.1 nucleotide sugar dehydrogenase [Anaeromicrobium sp.]